MRFALWGELVHVGLGFVTGGTANRQQSRTARGITSIRAAESLSCPRFPHPNRHPATVDRRNPSSTSFAILDFQPAHLADADPNRAHLDHRVVCDLLGCDEDIYQRRPPPLRQVVRRTLRPRRQGPPQIRSASGLAIRLSQGLDHTHGEAQINRQWENRYDDPQNV